MSLVVFQYTFLGVAFVFAFVCSSAVLWGIVKMRAGGYGGEMIIFPPSTPLTSPLQILFSIYSGWCSYSLYVWSQSSLSLAIVTLHCSTMVFNLVRGLSPTQGGVKITYCPWNTVGVVVYTGAMVFLLGVYGACYLWG